MKAKIKSLVTTDLNEERITLEILQDCDIGKYFVFDSTYASSGKPSNKVRFTYWFPNKAVKAGDFVVLYTKEGTKSEHKNRANTTTHVFYWGLKHQIWNDKKDCAVVVEINNWIHLNYKE